MDILKVLYVRYFILETFRFIFKNFFVVVAVVAVVVAVAVVAVVVVVVAVFFCCCCCINIEDPFEGQQPSDRSITPYSALSSRSPHRRKTLGKHQGRFDN